MANEEDDPIIQEIDVFLARSLLEKLYLFQGLGCRQISLGLSQLKHLILKCCQERGVPI
uniref:Uncharacterized protein n=1 Tax=Nothoprocta perdicaria TaxID=30464 RepID=A0A8C6YYB7_NOTPE